jgi:hypothetical protein
MPDRSAAETLGTEQRCSHVALGDIESRCEREHGHGGAHHCAVDSDPHWRYVISWWPKDARAEARDA